MDDLVVRVLTDQRGIAKRFDYVVPDDWRGRVQLGMRVRVALGPRRVGGWITEIGVQPEADRELRPLAKLSSLGPDPELIDLAEWATWRWAARSPVPFLQTASPARNVVTLPSPGERRHEVPPAEEVYGSAFTTAAAGGTTVLRLPPDDDLYGVVQAAVHLGDALFLCATRPHVDHIAARLRRAGIPVAAHPDDWAAAAAGGYSVVGTRSAVWARIPALAAIVVVDEHDEAHQEEGSPTWHARDVAVERARRAGIPCVLTSPMPTLEAQRAGPTVGVERGRERSGWPAVVIADRREDDTGRNALFSPAFVEVVRAGDRVVCVLNQKGRAALLGCRSCGELARCERCDAAVHRPEETLVCRRCATERPVVCAACGGTRIKTIRMGVTRVRDDLEALAGEPVALMTGDTPDDAAAGTRLVVGTEAVLHRVSHADVVAFLDFDQELFAPRYRAAEQALALVVRAARVVGGRRSGGRLLIQTRAPDHEVVEAALSGNPVLVSEAEARRRQDLRLPPEVALAEVAGPAAEEFVAAISTTTPVMTLGPVDGKWRISAADHDVLCDVLAATPRPNGRLRLAVDPQRN